MEPTGSNNGVAQISVANKSSPSLKNMLKTLLWAILIKKEARKDVDCQQILYTNIKLVIKERKQPRQNGIEVTAEKIIQTIPYARDVGDDDDDYDKM